MYIRLIVVLIALAICSSSSSRASASSEQYTCPSAPPASCGPADECYKIKPYVDGSKTFIGGEIKAWTGEKVEVTSPIIDTVTNKRMVIGVMAQLQKQEALAAVASAQKSWQNGQGLWPQMSPSGRIAALEKVVASLKLKRAEIVNVLVWEICKNLDDAASEFDRTIIFIEATIKAYRDADEKSDWKTVSGILARVRRAAIGIFMCLGPFNYPINETYATMLPALLMGNVIILKLPTLGGLAHILTMEAFAEHLPPGVINFVSGSGRTTMGPIMQSGAVDVLAFIGGSKAADAIIKDHPHPHRLKVFLQLEGKNLGIVLPDADLNNAVEQITLGSTNYNGQRCTAIKLVLVHASVAEAFVEKLKV